jgi:ergothioneine biosynthesis protein EgtB
VTIAEHYVEVRAFTEWLAAPLSAEDQTVQSMPDTSPTKWHRAHTTWFFETFFLAPYAPAYERFDTAFDYLFNSYYDAVGPRHPRVARGLLTRPGIETIRAYRDHVDAEMADFFACGAPDDLIPLVELGLHHEQQHQELLLMDAKHLLGTNPLQPSYGSATTAPVVEPPLATWRSFERQIASIGHHGSGFAFDNESPRHDELLFDYSVRDSLVTNAEWLAFIDDGGYRRPELWMSDGWAVAAANHWDAPLYWAQVADTWIRFTLHGAVPLTDHEPVSHISWYEADAFARWAHCRLPTEAEWEAAAPEPSSDHETFALEPWSANSWYGQVWQWTASPYIAFPGFRPVSGAVGEYNAKFMVNQHVLRGSACITAPGHARRTYRNFFPPNARWPFSGLRLCR